MNIVRTSTSIFLLLLSASSVSAQTTITLDQARQAALANSPNTTDKQLYLDAGTLRAKAVGDSWLPQVKAVAEGTYQSEVTEFDLSALGFPAFIISKDQYHAGFEVQQTIYEFGATHAQRELALTNAQAQAASSRVTQARSSLLPALSLSGNAGRPYTSSIPNGSNTYTVSLGLTIPIFSGFSRQYDLKAAEWLAAAAQAQADAVRQQVVFDVFSSYYALQTATHRVETADDLLASAQQSSDVALGRYKAGVGTVLDLLAAQSALADARSQRVQARLAWSVGLAQLTHDAGLLDVRGGSPLRLVPVPAATNTAPSR